MPSKDHSYLDYVAQKILSQSSQQIDTPYLCYLGQVAKFNSMQAYIFVLEDVKQAYPLKQKESSSLRANDINQGKMTKRN